MLRSWNVILFHASIQFFFHAFTLIAIQYVCVTIIDILLIYLEIGFVVLLLKSEPNLEWIELDLFLVVDISEGVKLYL